MTLAPASLPSLDDLEAAARLVYGEMPPTPQYRWPLLDERCGCEVWVKHENHSPVGAFKVRGGIVYVDSLRRRGDEVTGLVSATRGNHGQSVGRAAASAGIPATIVVPHGNSREKNAAMEAFGVELIEHGDDFQASLEFAGTVAAERGWHQFPSFDPLLVQGVGTYAVELFRAAPPLDAVYVPIGLGSGICGVLAARDALGLDCEVVGVVSAHAPAYALSLEKGDPVSHPVTTVLSDGMACRTPNDLAFATMRGRVARVVQVTDAEVATAMRVLYTDTHNVAEGGGAAGLAAILQEREQVAGRRVAFVLSGGNVDADLFGRVLAGEAFADEPG